MKFQEIINQEKPVLVDFFAEWCGPCKIQAPMLQDLKQTLGESISIIKIDIDKNRQLADHFQVRSVPTLMIFKNGEVQWRESGVFPTSKLEEIFKTML